MGTARTGAVFEWIYNLNGMHIDNFAVWTSQPALKCAPHETALSTTNPFGNAMAQTGPRAAARSCLR